MLNGLVASEWLSPGATIGRKPIDGAAERRIPTPQPKALPPCHPIA